MGDLGKIGDRQATSNGFYLSVVSALLGIIAITKPGDPLKPLELLLLVVVPFFACLLCWIWWNTIAVYSNLFKVKFDVLRAMEKELEIYPIYVEEEAVKVPRLLNVQRWVPVILALPFVAILVYGVIAACKMLRL